MVSNSWRYTPSEKSRKDVRVKKSKLEAIVAQKPDRQDRVRREFVERRSRSPVAVNSSPKGNPTDFEKDSSITRLFNSNFVEGFFAWDSSGTSNSSTADYDRDEPPPPAPFTSSEDRNIPAILPQPPQSIMKQQPPTPRYQQRKSVASRRSQVPSNLPHHGHNSRPSRKSSAVSSKVPDVLPLPGYTPYKNGPSKARSSRSKASRAPVTGTSARSRTVNPHLREDRHSSRRSTASKLPRVLPQPVNTHVQSRKTQKLRAPSSKAPIFDVPQPLKTDRRGRHAIAPSTMSRIPDVLPKPGQNDMIIQNHQSSKERGVPTRALSSVSRRPGDHPMPFQRSSSLQGSISGKSKGVFSGQKKNLPPIPFELLSAKEESIEIPIVSESSPRRMNKHRIIKKSSHKSAKSLFSFKKPSGTYPQTIQEEADATPNKSVGRQTTKRQETLTSEPSKSFSLECAADSESKGGQSKTFSLECAADSESKAEASAAPTHRSKETTVCDEPQEESIELSHTGTSWSQSMAADSNTTASDPTIDTRNMVGVVVSKRSLDLHSDVDYLPGVGERNPRTSTVVYLSGGGLECRDFSKDVSHKYKPERSTRERSFPASATTESADGISRSITQRSKSTTDSVVENADTSEDGVLTKMTSFFTGEASRSYSDRSDETSQVQSQAVKSVQSESSVSRMRSSRSSDQEGANYPDDASATIRSPKSKSGIRALEDKNLFSTHSEEGNQTEKLIQHFNAAKSLLAKITSVGSSHSDGREIEEMTSKAHALASEAAEIMKDIKAAKHSEISEFATTPARSLSIGVSLSRSTTQPSRKEPRIHASRSSPSYSSKSFRSNSSRHESEIHRQETIQILKHVADDLDLEDVNFDEALYESLIESESDSIKSLVPPIAKKAPGIKIRSILRKQKDKLMKNTIGKKLRFLKRSDGNKSGSIATKDIVRVDPCQSAISFLSGTSGASSRVSRSFGNPGQSQEEQSHPTRSISHEEERHHNSTSSIQEEERSHSTVHTGVTGGINGADSVLRSTFDADTCDTGEDDHSAWTEDIDGADTNSFESRSTADPIDTMQSEGNDSYALSRGSTTSTDVDYDEEEEGEDILDKLVNTGWFPLFTTARSLLSQRDATVRSHGELEDEDVILRSKTTSPRNEGRAAASAYSIPPLSALFESASEDDRRHAASRRQRTRRSQKTTKRKGGETWVF